MTHWRELTDKVSLGYYPVYEYLAGKIGLAGHVLEVGVYSGGSLMMWQELFPEGVIVGVDNNKNSTFPEGTIAIIGNQDDPEMAGYARTASPGGYDLIVDDASHEGHLSEVTFRLLFPLVKPGGYYVLEDWAVGYLPQYGFDDSMLRFAQSFLKMLTPEPGTEVSKTVSPGDIDVIEYRFSQAIIHRRSS